MFLPLLSPLTVYPLMYLSMRPWETFSLLFCGKTYFFSRRIWSPRVRRFFSSAAKRTSGLLAGSIWLGWGWSRPLGVTTGRVRCDRDRALSGWGP
jgi:hypothetical protein